MITVNESNHYSKAFDHIIYNLPPDILFGIFSLVFLNQYEQKELRKAAV